VPFLLIALIGWHLRAGMRLPNNNIHEVHLGAPLSMKPFEWLDRANRCGSCQGPKV
jgi:hypothetical protein